MRTHCLYFVCPLTERVAWKQNIERLVDYRDRFNGTVSVAVVQGSGLAPLSEVQDAFGDMHVNNWITGPNDNVLREVKYWVPLLETVQHEDGYTWFGHTKGITRVKSIEEMTPVARWVCASYLTTLDNMDLVRKVLEPEHIGTCGPFRRIGKFWQQQGSKAEWHFSGTFFWLKNSQVFERDWKHVEQHTWGLEAYPGTAFELSESVCLFHDRTASLYDNSNWLRRVGPDLQRWKALYATTTQN